MITLEERPRTDRRRPSRALWLAAAAAAVVLLVGVATLLVVRDDDQDRTAAAAVAVAEEFVAARNAWDAAGVRAVLADDVDPGYFADPEFERVTGAQFDDATCTPTTTDMPVAVTCTYQMHNAWSDALGTGTYDGAFELVVDGDTITAVANDFPFLTNGFSTEVWEPFQNWIEAAHPDDFDVMYVHLSDGWDARVTPEALALWTTRTTEFVEDPPTTSD